MTSAAENGGEQRIISIKVPLDLWERINREAHRRSLEAGRSVSATAVVRSTLAAVLGADPVAVNAPQPRKAIINRVAAPRVRTRATGFTAAAGG